MESLEDAPSTFLNLGSLHSDLIEQLKKRMGSEAEALKEKLSSARSEAETALAKEKVQAIEALKSVTSTAEADLKRVGEELNSKIVKPAHWVLTTVVLLTVVAAFFSATGLGVLTPKVLP